MPANRCKRRPGKSSDRQSIAGMARSYDSRT